MAAEDIEHAAGVAPFAASWIPLRDGQFVR